MSTARPPAPRVAAGELLRRLGVGRTAEMPAAAVAMQAEAMRRRRPWWLALNAVAALASFALLAPTRPTATLLPWGTLIVGIALANAVAAGARGHARAARPRIDVACGMALGAVWSAGLFVFGDDGTAGLLLTGQAVCLMMIAAGLAAPVPAVGLAFILPLATGVTVVAGRSSGPLMAFEIATLAVTAVASLLLQARLLVRQSVDGRALAEKSEVVSLLLREFEDQQSDWLWETDEARRLVNVTPHLAAQFGLPAARIEGRGMLELIAGDGWRRGEAAEPVRLLAERLLHRDSFRDLIVPVSIGDEVRWWSLSATARRDGHGAIAGFWGVGTDVTEQHRNVERIDRMARFDTLTGLANRAHVIDALGDALRDSHHSGGRSALMLIDLDRFKQVNDTLGHPIGDKLLVAVAGRLRGLAAAGDVCGRLGGDEFAVVLPNASDRPRIDALAERIVAQLSAPYEIDGHRLHIGASVGSATSPRDGRVVETLLRNADLALYRAKDDGRGVHRRYEPQLHAAAEQRRRIEGALHDAIERGELRLAYQPIVDTADGALTGFEALLRWTHPDLGVVAPDVFLPIAEDGRLIGRIGDWVMHTACRDAAGWPDGIGVSVNLAGVQLKDPQLPATIVAALSHSGLDPRRLELEIAETVFVTGGAVMTQAADRLTAIGVRMSLCDYASGQSTSFLRKDRFATVKIDRAFVRGVGAAVPESVAIVRAIVALADSLGMTTVAEGAETACDIERMRTLGCTRIQGWTVGQPLDAATAHAMAARRAPAAGGGRRVA